MRGRNGEVYLGVGEVRGDVRNVGRCGKVYGVNVEVLGSGGKCVGTWGGVCEGCGEVCGEVWGEPIHSSTHPPHSPKTFPHSPTLT